MSPSQAQRRIVVVGGTAAGPSAAAKAARVGELEREVDLLRQEIREAVDVVNVQQALINSWDSRTWESVRDLAEGAS